jgi:membrane fusion protein (multidrug efflux system)
MAGRLHAGLALGAAAIALGFYGWHWWQHGRFMEDTDDAYVGGDITVISAKVPGYIAAVQVTDNQFVHAGELLAKLDDSDYRAALARAEGGVAARQAEIANLDATRAVQTALIAQARAGVDASQAELVRAQDDDRRFERLVDRAAVSVQSAQKAGRLPPGRRQQPEGAGRPGRGNPRAGGDPDPAPAGRGRAGGPGRARSGAVEPALYRAARAHRWRGGQSPRPSGALCRHGQPADGDRAGTRAVDRCQFQGKPAGRDPSRQCRHGRGRCGARPGLPWPCGQRGAGHRCAVQRPAPENATGNFTKIVQRVPVRILLDSADGVLDALRPGLSVVARVDRRGQGS